MKVNDPELEKTFRRQLPVTIEPGLTMVILSTNNWLQPGSYLLHKDLINGNQNDNDKTLIIFKPYGDQ